MHSPQDKPWYQCRRTIVGLYTLTLLFALGLINKAEVAGAMVTVVLAVAGANSAQAILTKPANANAKQDTTSN